LSTFGDIFFLKNYVLLTKIVNSSLSSLITKSLIRITRELNKKFLMYFYIIYTIISPTFNYIYYP